MTTLEKAPATNEQAGRKVLVLLVGIPIGAAGAWYAFTVDNSVVSLLLLLAFQIALTIYTWPLGALFAEAAGWAAGADAGLVGIAIQFAIMLLLCSILPVIALFYWTYRWMKA